MENPAAILRRAGEQRRFRGLAAPPQPPVPAEKPPAAPAHRSSHASYTALMRSHDRMRTRHIAGQGGTGGA